MNLILACPTYGPVEPDAAKALRIAIMNAANRGHKWIGDASPNRMAWAVARNAAVKSLLDSGATEDAAIVWVDSDVILPPESIIKMAESGKDFITGVYFQRAGKHYPLVANHRKDTDTFQWMVKWPKNVIAPIDGCGFGCCLTSAKMLVDIEQPWFEYKKFSEDFDFCIKAKNAGYQLYVDTSILCGHLKDPEPATIETFVATNPDLFNTADTSSAA